MANLTAARIKTIRDKGRYGDGNGLFLNVTATGTKSWVQRVVVQGHRRDIGLGGYPAVSLAKARERAATNRSVIADGRDPIAEKRTSATPTFKTAAETVHEMSRPRWRSEKNGRQWLTSLELHAYPVLGHKRIDGINSADVLAVLTPIWTAKPEQARRVRRRMRSIFKWALAHGYISVNPAGEAIDGALVPQPAIKEHFRAIPYQEVGATLETVRASGASVTAKLCLRFLILTAARSGEARAAAWDEIDLDGATWTIPASRMKAGLVHRVPLSLQAVEVLRQAAAFRDGSGLLFPSPLKQGRPLSDMTLTKILRSVGLADRATVHGFRTSFKTWTMEQTDTPWAVGEAALAHQLGNAVEASYARSDLFDRRRTLMQQWADYLVA